MSYDYERYDGKRIVVDGEVIGLLAMEFGHEVEEVWEEYHAELVMTEEQERQSEAYKESLRRTLSAQYEKVATLEAENAKLLELIERLQPKDCEGNVLDIADTVNMLRSEYDGDHEWEDVVTELVLTKWGGDRWIVRGSKGEAWACDCAKTGYDEDAYEGSDDVEPISNPTLIEADNAKLRELLQRLLAEYRYLRVRPRKMYLRHEGRMRAIEKEMRELGVEVNDG